MADPARSLDRAREYWQRHGRSEKWIQQRMMGQESREARDFHEREAIAGGRDKRTLERQIQSYYHERLLKSRNPEKTLAEGRRLQVAPAGVSRAFRARPSQCTAGFRA